MIRFQLDPPAIAGASVPEEAYVRGVALAKLLMM